MKRTFSAHQITQAFRQVREIVAFEHGVDTANGENFSIRDVELMLMDILQPPQKDVEKKQAKALQEMKEDLNNFLFG
jgi:hypothetical protein